MDGDPLSERGDAQARILQPILAFSVPTAALAHLSDVRALKRTRLLANDAKLEGSGVSDLTAERSGAPAIFPGYGFEFRGPYLVFCYQTCSGSKEGLVCQ